MSDTARAGRPPRTVAFMNQKGGVGKTTSAVNLAAALAEAEHRVCLIDLDPQAHVMFHLGVEPEGRPTVYDLLTDPSCDVESCVVRDARPGLDLIPAETDLAAAETELAVVPRRQAILRQRLEGVLDEYDFVFIDCPPSLGLLTLNALALAREVFVPMQAHFLALQGVGKLLETVALVSRSVNLDLRVSGIILCMHEKQTTLAREVVADLDDFFEAARGQEVPWRDCRVLRPFVRRNVKVAEAPSYGQTVLDYAQWCPGAHDYRRLAESLAVRGHVAPAPAEATVEAKPTPPPAPTPPARPEDEHDRPATGQATGHRVG